MLLPVKMREEMKSQSNCRPLSSAESNRDLSLESGNQELPGPHDYWGFQGAICLTLLFGRSSNIKILVFNKGPMKSIDNVASF